MSRLTVRQWLSRLFAKAPEPSSPSPFYAISIRCGQRACQAALDSQGKRQLSREAPLLPLARCDRPEHCSCTYQHYEDRRSGARRAADHDMPEHGQQPEEERRQGKERRREPNRQAEDAGFFSVNDDSYYEHNRDTQRFLSLDLDRSDGVDPYSSGAFDKTKAWKSSRSR